MNFNFVSFRPEPNGYNYIFSNAGKKKRKYSVVIVHYSASVVLPSMDFVACLAGLLENFTKSFSRWLQTVPVNKSLVYLRILYTIVILGQYPVNTTIKSNFSSPTIWGKKKYEGVYQFFFLRLDLKRIFTAYLFCTCTQCKALSHKNKNFRHLHFYFQFYRNREILWYVFFTAILPAHFLSEILPRLSACSPVAGIISIFYHTIGFTTKTYVFISLFFFLRLLMPSVVSR